MIYYNKQPNIPQKSKKSKIDYKLLNKSIQIINKTPKFKNKMEIN